MPRGVTTRQRPVPHRPRPARSAIQLGYVSEAEGDTEAATRYHNEALAIARDRADARGIASAIEGLASAAVASDDVELAAMLLWHAALLRAGGATPLWDDDRLDVERTEHTVRARARRALRRRVRGGSRARPRRTAGHAPRCPPPPERPPGRGGGPARAGPPHRQGRSQTSSSSRSSPASSLSSSCSISASETEPVSK